MRQRDVVIVIRILLPGYQGLQLEQHRKLVHGGRQTAPSSALCVSGARLLSPVTGYSLWLVWVWRVCVVQCLSSRWWRC